MSDEESGVRRFPLSWYVTETSASEPSSEEASFEKDLERLERTEFASEDQELKRTLRANELELERLLNPKEETSS